MKNAQQQLDRLAELIGGKPWGFVMGKPRIYLRTGRKDAAAFFEFPDYTPDELGGARFRVFIENHNQPPAWYHGQRERLTQLFRAEALALQAEQAGASSLARRLLGAVARVRLAGETFDELSTTLLNGSAADAEVLFDRAIQSPPSQEETGDTP